MKDNNKEIVFDDLFGKHYPELLFYAGRFLPEQEAEDIVQDVFYELWENKESIDLGENIRAYLYRMVYSRSINLIKRKELENKYSAHQEAFHKYRTSFYQSRYAGNIIEKIVNKELGDEIEQAINQLPERCREVFRLSYLQELKNKEIAEVLDISLRTVEAHMYKALKQLRELLQHLKIFLIIFFLG